MKGFFGKILVINLTDQSYRDESIQQSVYNTYLGGKGLGAYLLLKHNDSDVDPLSPENNLIFALGPINDTKIWGSSRYGVFTKSPQTGIFSESYSGGRVAEFMSRAGYDAFVFKGAAKKPLFLEISDEGVVFNDADHLWGADIYETLDKVSIEVGRKDSGILAIGPAAENGVRFSIIANNYWRCAGRSGAGTVMGSKKIKALVFRGSKRREVAEPKAETAFVSKWSRKSKESPVVEFFRTQGTPGMVDILNEINAFPSRYWADGKVDHAGAINAHTLLNDFEVKPNACNRCFMACGRLTKVTEGKYKNIKVELEYETIFAFGGLCLIKNLDEIIFLNDVCDRLGMDTITAGNLAGFTIEASKRGKIKDQLEYGDAEAIAVLLHQIAFKEGIGSVLSEGIRHAASIWGLEDIAIHVKGLEPAGYDPRILKSMALAYATSDRGACHARTTAFKGELAGLIDFDQIEGKAEMLIDFEDRLTLMDALVGCRFYRDLYLWDELSQIIKITTGINLDKKGLKKIAGNIRDATQLFNLREGYSCEDDTLPIRFFKEGIGPENKVITQEELEKMKTDYYNIRGWNKQAVPEKFIKDFDWC